MRAVGGTCSRIRLTAWVITSTASSALRPFQGSNAPCAALPKNSTAKLLLAWPVSFRTLSAVDGCQSSAMSRPVEHAVARHVGLADQRLLGRRAEDLERARGGPATACARLRAMPAPRLAAPNRLWPQPWPSLTPSLRSSRRGTASLPMFGSASNSASMPITGRPLPNVATNAVGMPATPRSTAKPSFSRMPASSADERALP